ncbi:MAG: FAD-dependent oxidoreductase [Verrucomicrobiota bacterium]
MSRPTLQNQLHLNVVVLGGGFAGVYCAKELGKQLRKTDQTVGIVSEQNHMVFQPMLAEVAGGSLSPGHVINPIRMLCRHADVFRGEVMDIDLEEKSIFVNTGHFSTGMKLTYDHLVLALGAEVDLSRVPGMPEHAFLMQNVGDAIALRSTVISRMEEANVETRPEIKERLLTFTVVGGGYSGVETAGEIHDMLVSMTRFYHHVEESQIRVIVIHSRSRILNALGERLAEYARRKLEERGVEFHLERRVRAVTATRVYLDDGSTIETNTTVSTVGNAPNSLVRRLCQTYQLQHQRDRITTDAHFRVPGRDDLWAIGDCAHNPDADAEISPETAQFAMRHGLHCGKNLGAVLAGKPTRPFNFKGLGELASIGHRTAVAEIMGLNFSGFLAWFMWRTIYLAKLPGIERRLRVTLDWSLDLFFPRDINLLNPRYTKLLTSVHLEPGDHLFSTGDPAFSLYVVQRGKIELFQDGRVVRTIGPGDFFGERALVHKTGYFFDAIAAERTVLLSASGPAIMPILEGSRRFRRILAKTTAQSSAEDEMRNIEQKLPEGAIERSVASAMNRKVTSLSVDSCVDDALALFKKSRHSVYPMIKSDGTFHGCLHREDFFDYLKKAEVTGRTLLNDLPPFQLPLCREDQKIGQALESMVRVGRFKGIVLDDEGRLVGILALMDLLTNAAVIEESLA